MPEAGLLLFELQPKWATDGRRTRCLRCDKPIPLKRLHSQAGRTQFCSEACSTAMYRESGRHAAVNRRHRQRHPDSPAPPMTEGTASDRGALSELVVMVDLMRRGYQVYRAVSPAAGCDLLIVWGNTVRRVEVKTAKRCKSGGLKFDHGSLHPTRYDVLALAVHGGEVVYRPALEEPH